jgi:Rnl2 family RNA ligase
MRFRPFLKIGPLGDSAAGPWVATEKIHGANFVIAADPERIWFGKRKDWLADDAAFFGWQLIAGELAAHARAAADALAAPQVVLYGELFGGGYPHPEVAPVAGLSPVQTGVWYAPDLRWHVFDVLVARDDDDDGELLAFSDVEALAAGAGIATAPVVARGRHAELDRIVIAAPTVIPAALGLPPLAGNLREGIVLKPDRAGPAAARPIIKRKLPDFDDARFDAGETWSPGHLTIDELIRWGERLVNPARVASARSKVGTDRAAIIDEIVLDVAIDLATVFAAACRGLGPDDEAAIHAAVRAAADTAT